MQTTAVELGFNFIREFVEKESGIVLDEGKDYLIKSRLSPLARMEGYGDLDELIEDLMTKPFYYLHRRVVEAMTTNESSFFRDSHPFDMFRDTVLPELINSRSGEKAIHLWSAACSSGQEPYTISMVIHENFPELLSWDLRFFATDLSSEMVKRAAMGFYNNVEIKRGFPENLTKKYLEPYEDGWIFRTDLRRMFEYREMNLIDTWPPMPVMDIVFLRNVLIYFNDEVKADILRNVRKRMKPDGYLFLGSSESMISLDVAFDRVKAGDSWFYRPA